MTLSTSRISTSRSELTNITQTGFWISVDDQEYFIPFADYPAFKDAIVGQIYKVKRIGPGSFIGKNWI